MAVHFDNGGLFEYAGLCYLGAAKCEKAINNSTFEIHLLLKAARAFIKADRNGLALRSNAKQHVQGALDCYHSALAKLDDSSPIKAAIIREMKRIHPGCDETSNFVSPAHRAHDLDLAATECIRTGNFEAAYEKLNEICDDICERKVQRLYVDLLRKHEVTLILLMLLLELSSARQSPSHIKLYEYFANGGVGADAQRTHSKCMLRAIQSLIVACKCRQYRTIVESEIPSMASMPNLTDSQVILLDKLKEKYTRYG